MELLEAWGVPVYVGKLQTPDLPAIKEFVGNQSFEDAEQSGGHHTTNMQLFNEPIFSGVRDAVETVSLQYVTELGHQCEKLEVCSSWAVKLGLLDFVSPHRHANAYVSGVLYLTKGAPLHLHCPWRIDDMFGFTPYVEADPENPWTSKTKTFVPEEGSLIIMPSRLEHHVDQIVEMMPQERVSLAFNLLPTGSFGKRGSCITIQQSQ